MSTLAEAVCPRCNGNGVVGTDFLNEMCELCYGEGTVEVELKEDTDDE